MLAQHRCYPDIEKSLGHCTSLWTWERFHKDSDSRSYFTQEHMMAKLRYCAKDVYTMSLVRQAIQKYEKTIVGLSQSIAVAQASIKPYLTTTIQGIKFDEAQREKIKKENDRLMMHYMRIINILIGEKGLEDIKKATKKAKAFPGSNKQCCIYFHDLLGYAVVARSPETQKPSLGKKAMFKLALKYPENWVITFTLLYRQVQKEYSSLKFTPWKDDNDKIIKEPTNPTQENILSRSINTLVANAISNQAR